ncbi:MAG: S41 family peptidase [Syntrophomonas sp.]|nr:S41 family peptidase [Syntrophomonas sp.]
MKENKILRGLTTFFSIFGLLIFLSGGYVIATNVNGWSSLMSVVGLIKADSLYTSTSEKMIEGATAGIVASLDDPYSKYLNKKQWQELEIQLSAEFGGIGVYVVEMEGGKLVIVSPIKGTPAAKAGLKNGDIISKINGKSAVGMTQDEAVQLMRGDPGTQLDLSVFRTDDGQEHDYKIFREIINVPSVEEKVINESPLLGYIKLNQFHAHSAQEIVKSLNSLEEKKIKGLILDLRDNGGGDFDAALAIADIFLDNKEVVSVKDADDKETVHKAGANSYAAPLLVLVNKNSASASEILAGALQDNERAVLVGEKTFGKGLVQRVYRLPNGGALKLTTSKYFTPQGTDINQIGITPDYLVTKDDKTINDEQLTRAIELLKQKTQ